MPLTNNFLAFMAKNGSNGVREDINGNVAPASNTPGNGSNDAIANYLSSSKPGNLEIIADKEKTTTNSVPGTGDKARIVVRNPTQTPQEPSVTLSTTLEKSVSNTVTATSAVTSGTGFEATVGVNTPFTSVSGTITGNLEQTDSKDKSNTSSSTEQKTISLTVPVLTPPGHTYVAQLLYSQVRATIPYTYNIDIGGSAIYGSELSTNESAGEVAYYDKVKNVSYPGVNLNDLSTSFTGQPAVGQPYNTQRVDASLNVPGTATIVDGYGAEVLYTDETPTSSLLSSSEGSESGANVASVAAAMSSAASSTYYAPSDPTSAVGDFVTLDASHTHVVGTSLADEILAGPGNDVIDAGDGNNLVYGGSGNDVIMAEGSGVNTFIGGTGNALFRVQSSATGNLIEGGQGSNWIIADAPSTTITGGPGNDVIQLSARSSGGSVITDHAGINALTIGQSSAPLQFEQDGEGLIILLNGDQSFNASKDVVWTDFFESATNSVNGMSAAHLANRTQDGAFDLTAHSLNGTPSAMDAGMLPGGVHAQGGNSSLAQAFWMLGQQ